MKLLAFSSHMNFEYSRYRTTSEKSSGSVSTTNPIRSSSSRLTFKAWAEFKLYYFVSVRFPTWIFFSIDLNLLSINSFDASCSTTCWMYELTKFLFRAALLSSLRVQIAVIWFGAACWLPDVSSDGLNLFLLRMSASMSTDMSSTLPTLRCRFVRIFCASNSSCSAPSSWSESKSISYSGLNFKASPPCI